MRTTWLVAASLIVGGCGKSGSVGADGPGTVRAFVTAITSGDLDGARAYLPDAKACTHAPPDRIDQCKAGAVAMRAQIGGLVDDFPRGSKVTGVSPSKEPGPDPSVGMWTVELDGKPAGEMMTVTLGGRFYAVFPITKQ